MKNILKNPITNAVCISLFSAFYAAVFIATSGSNRLEGLLHYNHGNELFWSAWSRFLAAGHHAYIAYTLITLTILVVTMLISRRRHYDEYHISILLSCLAVATTLALIAIAMFYVLILYNPVGIIEKFTLFIVTHWISVVFADITYVLLCRWR